MTQNRLFAAVESARAALAAKPEFYDNSVKNVASVMPVKGVPDVPEGTNTPLKNIKKPFVESRASSTQNIPATLTDLSILEKKIIEAWAVAVEQYEPHRLELGKAYRAAVAARTVAICQNPGARVSASLTAFIPATLLARFVNCTESYFWKCTGGAEIFGRMIGHRPWVTTWDTKKTTQNIRGGSVWYTRPRALQEGFKASVPIEDLKHKWRDLQADIDKGCTARALIEKNPIEKIQRKLSTASITPMRNEVKILSTYLHSSLPQFTIPEGVIRDTVLTNREAIYDVCNALHTIPNRGHDARAEWVNELANSICHALNDLHSLGGWRRSLWICVKADAHGIGNARAIISAAIWSACILAGDNPKIRNRAALTRAKMNANGWHEIAAAVQSLKVGTVRA